MARFIRVASPLVRSAHVVETSASRNFVYHEVERILHELRAYALDLIVLPEGIAAEAQRIEEAESIESPGLFIQLYQQFAHDQHCHVAGSVKLNKNGKVFNSIVFIGRDGNILGSYDKTYLTISELEEGLQPGSGPVVLETPVGRLGGIVCFDLNDVTLRQQYKELRPDILCFSSMYHGGLVQAIWAYECRAFLISSLFFHGAGILDPFGRPQALTDCYNEAARCTINLDRAMIHLDYNRRKFLQIEKKYMTEVHIDIPANIGSALLYSLTEKRTAMDIVREFELELVDDYFHRARTLNHARHLS